MMIKCIVSDLGVQGKADVVYSQCLNRTKAGFQNFPEEGCVDTNKAIDKAVIGEIMNSTYLDMTGVGCSCTSSGCNDPRGICRHTLVIDLLMIPEVYVGIPLS